MKKLFSICAIALSLVFMSAGPILCPTCKIIMSSTATSFTMGSSTYPINTVILIQSADTNYIGFNYVYPSFNAGLYNSIIISPKRYNTYFTKPATDSVPFANATALKLWFKAHAVSAQASDTTNIIATHTWTKSNFIGKQGTPSVTVGAAAGAGATAVLTPGSDGLSGTITVLAGTSPTAGSLAELTITGLPFTSTKIAIIPFGQTSALIANSVYGSIGAGINVFELSYSALGGTVSPAIVYSFMYIVLP